MENNDLKNWMEAWFKQFMGRFDRLDKFMDIMSGRHNVLNGERLLDNQDLCQMLNVSKRTLQLYRTEGKIPYFQFGGKTLYRESDIQKILDRNYHEVWK